MHASLSGCLAAFLISAEALLCISCQHVHSCDSWDTECFVPFCAKQRLLTGEVARTPWLTVQVSDVVAEKLAASQKTEVAGKPSKAAATPLQDLFAVGQLVRCSIGALHDKDSSDGMPHSRHGQAVS